MPNNENGRDPSPPGRREPEPVAAPVSASAPALSVLHWFAVKGTSAAVFAGAAARERWQTSPQVEPTAITEATYDAIVRSVEFDRL